MKETIWIRTKELSPSQMFNTVFSPYFTFYIMAFTNQESVDNFIGSDFHSGGLGWFSFDVKDIFKHVKSPVGVSDKIRNFKDYAKENDRMYRPA